MSDSGLSRASKALRIRPGEQRLVALVALIFFGTQTTHALSANTADTLFFARFGVENLPPMFVVLGFVTGFGLIGYTAGLSRARRVVFYPGLLLFGAALMVILRILVAVDAPGTYPVVWVTSNTLLIATLTFMWNLGGDVVDARSAKRLFPLFVSAGILGGVAGNLATGPLASWLGASNILLVVGFVFLLVTIPTIALSKEIEIEPSGESPLADVVSSLRIGWESPLLRLVAIATVLAAVLFPLVVFPFSVEISIAFSTEVELAGYLGLFSAIATASTFLVSLLLVNRLFARLGVVTAWLIVAVVYIGGFGLWAVSLTLVTASVFRLLQWVAVSAIGGTARTALFNVLRSDRRGGVVAAYAAVPQQVGVILSGLILWLSLQAGASAGIYTGLLIAAAFAVVIWRMRSRYATSLLDSLRFGEADAFSVPIGASAPVAYTADAINVATETLRSESAQDRRLALIMLGRMGATSHFPAVAAALRDVDVDVRLAALESLRDLADAGGKEGPDPSAVVEALFPESGFAGGGELADRRLTTNASEWLVWAGEHGAARELLSPLMNSPDATDRVGVLGVCAKTCWTPDQGFVMDSLLHDETDIVRIAATRATRALDRPEPALAEALRDPVARVRMAAADEWSLQKMDPDIPLRLLDEDEPRTWEAALRALAGRATEVYDPVRSWAQARIEDLVGLAANYAALSALDRDPISMPASAYLSWIQGEIVMASERVAVRALALLWDEESVQLVTRGLRSDDPDTRAQALEAAETVGESLGRVVVPVLEAGAASASTISGALTATIADESPWIEELSSRAVGEVETAFPGTIDPALASKARANIARLGTEMADSINRLGIMERILQLRKVALFAELMPEDLERLAVLAEEVSYDTDETILHQGDVESPLVVILSGTVEVRPKGVEAGAGFGYGAGEHIGELTALSGRPRPASAHAVTRVEGLSISAHALTSLILDRPEVARQLIRILAERASDTSAAVERLSHQAR